MVAVKVVGSCFRKVALDQLLAHGPSPTIDKRTAGAEMMQLGRVERETKITT